MTKSRLTAILAVGTVVSGACFFLGEIIPRVSATEASRKAEDPRVGHSDTSDEGLIRITPEMMAKQDIRTVNVTGGSIYLHLLVPGTVTTDADRVARVPARVAGTVSEMRKRLGDPVEKGEVVAVLDSREVADAKSEYLTAAVRADLEKANYNRQAALWGQRIAAEAAFLNAKAAYAEASLREDLARQKLSALGLNAAEVARLAKKDEATPNASTLRQYELRAPIKGRIVERKVDIGTSVGKEGDPSDLYTVADLSALWIELAVPTAELGQIREGARVAIKPGQNDDGRRTVGTVIFVSPLLNQETRSARVIVSFPNPGLTWRPGTFVSAEVEVARDDVLVRVPRHALQSIAGQKVAFVRTEKGFQKRVVTSGRADDASLEITSGLQPGDEIAVTNTFLLKAELGKAEAENGH